MFSAHYGGQHHLNDRYLEEELNNAPKKVNGNSTPPQPRRSTRGLTRSSSAEDSNLGEKESHDHDAQEQPSDSGKRVIFVENCQF